MIIVTAGRPDGNGVVSGVGAGRSGRVEVAPEHAEAPGRPTGQAFPGVRASSPDPDMY
ncbi:hypothetical protein AB0B78_06685 [Streptomyces sp. NPDC040724]|uniref:hypothetical protein n=1 Tax=unclassified Streptomyces TaxID=2593676 RepID=UPI0033CC864F